MTEFTKNKHIKDTPQEKFDSSTLHIVFTLTLAYIYTTI